MKNRIAVYVAALLGIAFVFLMWYYPSQIPRPWFDEGWTLATARNWVETGRYARLLNGTPISATGMAWDFPVTAPVALSFRLFGFGIWQGRLPSALFTLASVFFIFLLAKKMYGEKTALVSITLIILGFPFSLLFGRQAIGEPAMIFYLLAGYYCFRGYLEKRSTLSLILSILLWALALTSKNQTLPFWVASMLAMIFFASLKKDRFIFRAAASATFGTIILWQGMLKFQHILEKDLPLYGAPMKGLLEVTGWVPVWHLRLQALDLITIFALPLLFGLGYALFQEKSVWQIKNETEPVFYLRLAYWVFVASWLFWFATSGMPWGRYLYPAVFLGNVFVAVLILRLTDGLNFHQLISSISTMLFKRQFKLNGLTAIIGVVSLTYIALVIIWSFKYTVLNNDVEKIAEYLNQTTPENASIETYDSELLFLVDRRFHYPPDQIQVELNKRKYLYPLTEIPYDPMLTEPDYIVVGPYGNMWELYKTTIDQEDLWELIHETSDYKVYQRTP
ncbi:MAG: hypothetical protein HN855_14680 [Anaerolineae bacterium]|nr:hypothetical protein [Anaerolineae bacterium]MBT7070879.1 hypothetical protein [Anaerolineae bacterium]MBT7326401.1 hypothetical protein [Anaerolineae bacterium]